MSASPAEIAAAQAAANRTAEQLQNLDLTHDQRAAVVEQLRTDVARIDQLEQEQQS